MYSPVFSKNIQANIATKSLNNIYATNDSLLFVTNRKGFLESTCKGYNRIYKVNAFTGVEENCFVPISPAYIENGGVLNHLWIWALAVSDSLLFLAVDEEIWIYQLNVSGEYEYFMLLSLKNVSHLEWTNNKLHAFVENNDGFDWFKIDLANYQIDTIMSLVLKNRLFLQIAPVKMITMSNHALYLLQQNLPAIEKYSLTGELLSTYPLEISNWRKIPDTITHKIDSIEDITERNYAFSTYSIFDYNMMHLFYVFPSERFFMVAVDKNKNTDTFITPYFVQIMGDTTTIEPYYIKLPENEKFAEKFFPFRTAASEGNLVFAQLRDHITQINISTLVSWQNKTENEYKKEVNFYHRDHDPIEKIETYKFIKDYIPVDSIHFLDYDDTIFYFNDIKNDKAIFIISQYPQCSACIKTVWNYFSNKKMFNTELYTVTQNCSTYLQKKENIKEVKSILKTEFTPLFMDTNLLNAATNRILTQKANPIVVLFDKHTQHIEIISAMQIIGDFMGTLNPLFLRKIDNFVRN